jgi:hypothetical protein
MIFLQASDIMLNVVWQEFFACLAVLQCGLVIGVILPAIWRAYEKGTKRSDDDIETLKQQEKYGRY